MRLVLTAICSMFVCFAAGVSQTLPPVTVTVKKNPAPGYLYIAPNSRVPNPPYAPSLMVIDTGGNVVRSRFIPEYAFDFRPLADGRLGYSIFQSAGTGPRASSSIYIVDSLLRTVDSVVGGNGYNLAMHSFMVLPNGNKLVIMQENVTIDMSAQVPGGHPAASVQQMILQEIDQANRVIFQWRALDHLPVTMTYEDMTAPSIRPFHINAVEVDTDGHFLLSLRHSSAVIKVHRTTGATIWILGGKLNQFTFSAADGITDPAEFSYQHDIRRLPNGNITVFDNGTQRVPQWSRGVEYKLDETAKTCELVWQHRNSPDIYAGVQGSMQTLPNGNRLLAWGSALLNGQTVISEVDPTGTTVFEARMPNMMFPYKAEKLPFPMGKPADTVLIDEILPKNTYIYTNTTDTVGLKITYHTLVSFFYNTTTAKRFTEAPVNPRFAEVVSGSPQPTYTPVTIAPARITITQEGMVEHGGEFRFDTRRLGLRNPEQLIVYRRDTIGVGTFFPLRTRYNSNTRELVVDTTQVGEFCFGVRRPTDMPQLQTPRQIQPIAGKHVLIGAPVVLQSSGVGITRRYNNRVVRKQGDTDVTFFERATQNDKDTTTAPVVPGMYYWTSQAEWDLPNPTISASQTVLDSFEVSLPFLEILKPAELVIWSQDSAYPIRWETNVPFDVTLELVKGDAVYTIADSVPASAGGFLWKVPTSIPVGTDYAVRVRSREGNPIQVSVTSDEVVEIKEIPVSVAQETQSPLVMKVSPNPASSFVIVSGQSPVDLVEFYSMNGVRVLAQRCEGASTTVSVENIPPGTYVVVTSAGNTSSSSVLVVYK